MSASSRIEKKMKNKANQIIGGAIVEEQPQNDLTDSGVLVAEESWKKDISKKDE